MRAILTQDLFKSRASNGKIKLSLSLSHGKIKRQDEMFMFLQVPEKRNKITRENAFCIVKEYSQIKTGIWSLKVTMNIILLMSF